METKLFVKEKPIPQNVRKFHILIVVEIFQEIDLGGWGSDAPSPAPKEG